MKARPILMSAPMARALLDGKKTQTRRIVKGNALDWLDSAGFDPAFVADSENRMCPYGQPRGLLWVREAWTAPHESVNPGQMTPFCYRATNDAPESLRWKPSIHMPRWASRLTLELTEVRVERLQDITEADAIAEGAEPVLVHPDGGSAPHIEGYRCLWESINGPSSWEANPWVWVLGFRVHQKNVDALLAEKTRP